MRDLADYSLRDWMVGQPAIHGARRLRNVVLDRVYARRRAVGQEAVARALGALEGRFLATTVAFNLPEAVGFLSQTMARFCPGMPLLVCDNSSDPAARTRIAQICAQEGRLYCALPPVPTVSFNVNGSRSHGVALNWVWRNLIRPARLSGVALLDHDLIPLEVVDLQAHLLDQPVYGMVREGARFGAWYLWPGYSLFNLKALGDPPLDFGTDTPRTLDTGGQNWRRLYRGLDRSRLRMAQTRQVWLRDRPGEAPEPFLLVDGWLHVGGAGHRGGGAAALGRVASAYAEDPQGLVTRLRASTEQDPAGPS